jgi:hypothetical protein
VTSPHDNVLSAGPPDGCQRELMVVQGNVDEHPWPIRSRAWHVLEACAAAC